MLFSLRLVFCLVFVTSLSNFLLHAADDDIEHHRITASVTYKFADDVVKNTLFADLITNHDSFAMVKRILSKFSCSELEEFYDVTGSLNNGSKDIKLVLVGKFEGIVSNLKCVGTMAMVIHKISSLTENEQTTFFDSYSALITPEMSGENILMYIDTLSALPNEMLSHLAKTRPKYFSRVSIWTINRLVEFAKTTKMDEVEFWRRLVALYPSGRNWFDEAFRYFLRRSVTTNDPEWWKVLADGFKYCFDYGADGESFRYVYLR